MTDHRFVQLTLTTYIKNYATEAVFVKTEMNNVCNINFHPDISFDIQHTYSIGLKVLGRYCVKLWRVSA